MIDMKTSQRVALTLPDGRVIEDPTVICIDEILSHNLQRRRTVGDIWLHCRPNDYWKDKKINPDAVRRSSEILFYAGHAGGIVVVYSDGDHRGHYAYIWDNTKDSEFSAEDDGGSDWILNEKYLMPIKKAAELAGELIDKHRLTIDQNWVCLLPEW